MLNRLRQAGHEALLAGGCVRDMLLGRPCADYDIATSAAPDEVRGLFRRVLMIGAKFGVVMVIHDNRQIEVATFRSDLSYSDGRRPDGVRFTTARQDAERRDFTINGMFYDPLANEVLDYVGGQEDLKQKIIRTIGSPDRRFAEDYLRMIRAVRFAVRLDFAIDEDTARA
ncbi:MAG: CCA tRNA nucleotidyltransferase, partial [Phycisphaerae bacterium]|nr:CCA tRNA nucleotidyltransferase [Phycisphaerae bacterium]